ncbi:MAG: PQQ-like beta-propeller repeat protein [Actinobacteria bacterium]|nr:PQQ-like beta-propeller repeat protein [Actinomycetota bacterium]MBU2686259.1 PQQ-like beta-propeller repeat protein [Actinomycetota bacterium]
MTDGIVRAIVTTPDTTYIGGDFNYVGPNTGSGVFIDASTGQPAATYPRVDGQICACVPDGSGGWYIGGSFTMVSSVTRNGVAHILSDGTLDSAWDPDANGTVNALAVSGSTVYAGGAFSSIGGQNRNNMAALDAVTGNATSWDPDADGAVNALAVSGSTVYAGGNFSDIGGQERDYIAAIDTTSGSPTTWAPDADDQVNALAVSGSTVYAGGQFMYMGGQYRNRIAAVDATTGNATAWDPDANDPVLALGLSGSTVYTGGYFTSIGGQARNYVAAIDETSGNATAWDPDANASIYTMALSGSTVYAGGYFTSIGGQARNRVAAVDTTTGNATAWDPRANGRVNALALSGSTVYAGGQFSSIGGETRNHIAALDTDTGSATAWNPSADGNVNALAVSPGTVYAGGEFTSIGGQARNRIAAIDATSGSAAPWNPGADGTVDVLETQGSIMYAGGDFANIGGQARSRIAAIEMSTGNATAWNPDADGTVNALALSGDTVYAGGEFANIGGQGRDHIAAIDPSTGSATSWMPDTNGNISALALSSDDMTVYAGGGFTRIGYGSYRNNIAALDVDTANVTNWDPNADSVVSAFAVSGSTIYVGGYFWNIGGQARRNAAAIDVTTGNANAWDPDPNNSYAVYAIAVSGSTVYAGGQFTVMGGRSCSYFARFDTPPNPLPATTDLDPAEKTAGDPGFTLTVNGTDFIQDSTVRWNGADRATTYVSDTQLEADVTASDLAAAGTFDITVFNPAPGGGESNPQAFTVNPETHTVAASVSGGHGSATPATQTVNPGGSATINISPDPGYKTASVTDNGTPVTPTPTTSYTINNVTADHTVVATFAQDQQPDSTWYLAEGTNAWGFSTYISIENPDNAAVHASINYMTCAGNVSGGTITLPAMSQTTVNPADKLGNTDFSTRVECLEGRSIAVDRTMFWTGPGAPSPDGHSSIGTTAPSKVWYLPEGSSAWNFETWTLIQNPGATDAHVRLTYMTEAGAPLSFDETVPAHHRATYSMASFIGEADASTKVTSDVPVIAERSMYRNNRREGSCSIGATTPATDYFLAEGATGFDVGFTTYVLVQNPNNSDAQVTLTYQTPSGAKPQAPFTMGANSRKTVRVNDQLPPDTNVSTQVHGSKPIIAERAMYWGEGTPLGEAMHASIGLDSPHMSFYLPDGQTSHGHETWTLVQNPNPGAVTIRITYLLQNGGTPVSFTDEITPGTRSTYNMADKGISGRASILVQSLDGAKPVMVERSMYWNSRGAGTDTIGGFSD